MPACATTTQQRPRRTLCPICTRLSRREPAPITVSWVEPRSIVLLAPTSTSSSRITRPSCGTVRKPAASWRSRSLPARSARPDTRAPGRPARRASRWPARRSGSPRPITHAVADHRAGADRGSARRRGARPDHRQRPDLGRWDRPRRRVDHGARMDARPDRRRRMEQRGDAGPGDIGLGRHDGAVPAGTRPARSGCTITAPARVAASSVRVLLVVEEADLLRARRLQRRHAVQRTAPPRASAPRRGRDRASDAGRCGRRSARRPPGVAAAAAPLATAGGGPWRRARRGRGAAGGGAGRAGAAAGAGRGQAATRRPAAAAPSAAPCSAARPPGR